MDKRYVIGIGSPGPLDGKKGDKIAADIIDKCLNYLGICLVNIVNTSDPEMVIIGGGVSKAGYIVFDKVKEVVNKRTFVNTCILKNSVI